MLSKSGQCLDYALLVHGGAGPMDPDQGRLKGATTELKRIAEAAMAVLQAGDDPMDAIVLALKEMELAECFNAGTGSALQGDGLARLTAAIMESDRQTLSGVISTPYITHPSELARHLQTQSSRMLTVPGSELVARKLSSEISDNLTPKRLQQWAERIQAGESFCDTVGVIIRTPKGRLLAGTSTGGRGNEFPGRVSDSATVAGTYCTKFLACGATGIGEEIVDDAVCARLESRVRDGQDLIAAAEKSFKEAVALERQYGWIAVDATGLWVAHATTPAMSYVVFDGAEMVASSLEA